MNANATQSEYNAEYNKIIKNLEKCVLDFFCACEDLAEKIPDNEIRQAIKEELIHGTERVCWMRIEPKYLEKDKVEFNYSLGEVAQITGKIRFDGLNDAITQLENYVLEMYQRQISFRAFRWEVRSQAAHLCFSIPFTGVEQYKYHRKNDDDDFLPDNILAGKTAIFVDELRKSFPNVELSVIDNSDECSIVITIADTI